MQEEVLHEASCSSVEDDMAPAIEDNLYADPSNSSDMDGVCKETSYPGSSDITDEIKFTVKGSTINGFKVACSLLPILLLIYFALTTDRSTQERPIVVGWSPSATISGLPRCRIINRILMNSECFP